MGIFAKIDAFLGSYNHGQIVILAYSLSALVILCLLGFILAKAHKSKIQLGTLEKRRQDRK